MDAVAAVDPAQPGGGLRRSRRRTARLPRTLALLPHLKPATEEDWGTEYLGPVLAVRIVDTLDDAIEHIARWGSGHTDAIVTEDLSAAQRFQREVDSSSVS